jgi:TatD DNase family protein
MLVDSHAHLFLPNFENDLDEVLSRAKANGVKYIIVPGTDIETSKQAIKLADKYEQIYAAVGVHPHDSKDWDNSWINEIEKLAEHPKVVAIGEIGLDYFYDFSPKENQHQAFKAQLDLAIKLDLPVVIHNRDSNDDIMNYAREYASKGLRAQFHCFAGSIDDAHELVELGYKISFTGNITFKKSDELREIVKSLSVENILLETDSPFLTPVPYRGKRNEPSYVKYVAKQVAELHHLRINDIERTTTYNVFRLFGVGEEPKLAYTYRIGKSLYINVTNRCDADCVFCDRKGNAVISGYKLKMEKSQEPPAGVYINEIGDPLKYKEVVFCGYGEPTLRWDIVKEVAKYVKEKGGKTRLDTNGHGNYINKRDITPELDGLIDSVSISLNSIDAQQYAALMRVDPKLHQEMINFARKAKQYAHVQMTVVGLSEVDTEKAAEFVKNEIGVQFKVRGYFPKKKK